MAKPDLSDYNEVADRVREFHANYPDGRLRADHSFIESGGVIVGVVVKAYAFRTADDPMPASGLAWEPIPGKTPYTKDSELQNAETSAWGRAIVASGASRAKKIASYEEVRNRQPAQPETAPNAEGTDAFFKLAKDKGISLNDLVAAFEKQIGIHPKAADNNILNGFVNLVKTGVVNIDVTSEPVAG